MTTPNSPEPTGAEQPMDDIVDDNPIAEIGRKRLDRRSMLKLGLGGSAAVALGVGATSLRRTGGAAAAEPTRVGLAATDGWISMPVSGPLEAGYDGIGVQARAPFFPDELGADLNGVGSGRNVYSFGFREVTTLNGRFENIIKLKNHVQHTSPPLYRGMNGGDWRDFTVGDRIEMELWNLGLAQRPDLADGHTLHWHGFPNQIPYFDGVPETSISVPVGRSFTYEFIPNEAGTYMYHCHFEDVEHVQMGMTGVLFVRPADYSTDSADYKTVYGFGTESEFNREFTWMLTEIDLEEHWLSSHIQQPDWTEHRPAVFMINGRTFPDTLVPSVDISPRNRVLNPRAPGGIDRLTYQPVSSLVQGNVGEKVLIRMANLGFRSHAIELSGLPMRIVGIDAKPLITGRGPYDAGDPTRTSRIYETNSVDVPPGRSLDVIIQLPDTPGTYPIAARGITGSDVGGGGSMRSEVRVHDGSLPAQSLPNF